ncbi:UNVERIFIED_CONTAM: hypothetical protein Sradi_7062800 [Sesamum radiatum]|uniref:Uncharacterized protein n=1 Tax=Sesamum radiatum TaxID=300843 RepID=A0AAW2J7D4_SESRA
MDWAQRMVFDAARLDFWSSTYNQDGVPDDGMRSCPTDAGPSSYYDGVPYDYVFGLAHWFHNIVHAAEQPLRNDCTQSQLRTIDELVDIKIDACKNGCMLYWKDDTDLDYWHGRHFDRTYPDFAAKPHNVRLDLCTDGFVPHGQYNRTYSCWFVILIPYNLPQKMCMSSEYIVLMIVIPGPINLKRHIDVYLELLIEELQNLGHVGVQMLDNAKNEILKMCAALMWPVNDLPAYGMASGWSIAGFMGSGNQYFDYPHHHPRPHCQLQQTPDDATPFGAASTPDEPGQQSVVLAAALAPPPPVALLLSARQYISFDEARKYIQKTFSIAWSSLLANDIWLQLLAYWTSENFQQESLKNKANWAMNPTTFSIVHRGGSSPIGMHKRNMGSKLQYFYRGIGGGGRAADVAGCSWGKNKGHVFGLGFEAHFFSRAYTSPPPPSNQAMEMIREMRASSSTGGPSQLTAFSTGPAQPPQTSTDS